MINRQDPIFIQWNIDSNNNKISIVITNEQHQITNAQFTLVQLPDYNTKVRFPNDSNMYEIDLSQQITNNKQFKVDYNTGIVSVHSDLEASVVSVNYSGKGIIKYPATRIYDVIDNVPIDSAKSLQDYINKIKEYVFEDFDPTKVYNPNKITYYQGSSYVCIQQTLNHEIPTNTAFWRTMTAGFNYRENYSNETDYAPRDMVFYEAEQTIYLCVKASTGNLPTDTEYWVATVSVKGAATYAVQQGDYAKSQGDYAKGQGDYTKNERESIIAEYAILKNDFLNATHVEMITVVNDEFVATVNNTAGFELALGTYNPLIDILQLAYKGVPLYEGDQYILTGMTVNFIGFTLNSGEKIKIRIEKAVRDTPPIGSDGSDLMDGSVGELKFADDVKLKLNRMVIIQDYTFTATEDNTTTFTVEASIFNPTTDVLDIYRENLKLTKDTNYSLTGQEVALFEGLNINESVEYRITKNVGNSIPLMPDGSLIQDGSVGELKLTEDARIKLNKSIIIESHTFTATSDNTTNFVIESTIFNPLTDHVELTYEGENLKQDENYSLTGCQVTLGFPINVGQKIDYDITKFVNQVSVPEGEYIIPDNSIAAIKLTQDVQQKINKVPTIEQEVINARDGKTTLKDKIDEIDDALSNNPKLGYTNTILDTWKKRFENVQIDVVDFGADPTGVTDSTVAIQNAINSNSGASKTLTINGVFKITSTLVSVDNVTFDFKPNSRFELYNGSPCLRLGNNNKVINPHIKEMRSYATIPNTTVGISATSKENIEITGGIVEGFTYCNITITGCNNVKIDKATLRYAGIKDDGNEGWEGCGVALGGDSKNIRINHCYCHDNGKHGIQSWSSSGYSSEQVIVSDCLCIDNGDIGIVLSYAKYFTISNNICIHNGVNGGIYGGQGIQVVGRSAAETASYGTISSNTVDGNTENGIEVIGYAKEITITGNIARNNVWAGIKVAQNCSYITASGNITNNNFEHGIKFDDNCSYITISSNVANENSQHGIYSGTCSNVIINGVNVANNGKGTTERSGVSIVSGSEIIVSNVIAKDTQTIPTQYYGVRLYSVVGGNISNIRGIGNVTKLVQVDGVGSTGITRDMLNITDKTYGGVYDGNGIRTLSGSGSPEGVITAPIGSMYSRTDGGTGTSMYVKESGTGNVGWVGK